MKLLLVLLFTFGLSTACLAEVTIQVNDQAGQPLEDAVVELISSQPGSGKAVHAEVRQQDLTFVPFVSAVVRGTKVEFPNMDKTRHHVYSFSPAKEFELKLYVGKPEAPVLFDKAGIVALGCNIHDYMQAYIYVGTSPHLAVTGKNGLVTLAVPAGEYQLVLWHPWQNADWQPQKVTLSAGQIYQSSLAITHQQKPQKPKKGFGAYTGS
ncbi:MULTISPECIES: methylamine utilization protein [Rheinheimera]|uniref:Methylamine utilization protein n=1 Tax=Rheinheimera marina TaxID=1774958 RepID=A0ABV9JNZ5_9GAMM